MFRLKNLFPILSVGMAIFSMFFGGGNLTFPLWAGIETSSPLISSIGFILTGVLLPFYGIIIALYFKGDHEDYLSFFGKPIGQFLIFALLLFWIPFGSGPRCNLLAYGAYSSQFGDSIPFWIYSAFYSVVVYFLTFRKSRILEILGNFITPALIFALIFLIGSTLFSPSDYATTTSNQLNTSNFLSSFLAGYNTMDFIASIFFTAAIIGLIKEQKHRFDLSFIRKACIFAFGILSLVYIGMITVGYQNANILSDVPRDRLLPILGQALFGTHFQIIIFIIITLSVLSTSIALSLVFSDYIRKTIFRSKLSHEVCLFISVFISFIISTIGFDKLAILISYAMMVLYPVLLIITTMAFMAALLKSQKMKALYNRRNWLGTFLAFPSQAKKD
jgi:LIVCS family branched-chain amino acid:cation transporter